jgi:hypothetical protein
MLIDSDVDRVRCLTSIPGPEVALPETHAIERLQRQTRSRVSAFFRVIE